MIIPVRCYSCGKVVGDLYERYKQLLDEDYTEAEALGMLRLDRYCCRRMILAHVDLIDDLVPYSVPCVGTMPQIAVTPSLQQQPLTPTPVRPNVTVKQEK
jgi:DNA-directed RNA polymerase I, II, and III subunit RPABC5